MRDTIPSQESTEAGEPLSGCWLERLQQDDAKALEELLESYWAPLVGYARGMWDPRDAGDTAEDIAQEAFVRLWSGRNRWEANSSAPGLLYRIVRNLCLNERRRAANHSRLAPMAQSEERPPTPLDDLEATELERVVAATLKAMPARRREVFDLSRYHGLRYREIADVLEISPQTVANHLSAALHQLQQGLDSLLPHRGRSPNDCGGGFGTTSA